MKKEKQRDWKGICKLQKFLLYETKKKSTLTQSIAQATIYMWYIVEYEGVRKRNKSDRNLW
jgi:hypothetical protein